MILDNISIRNAKSGEASIVSSIIQEAADWLEESGVPLWNNGESRLDQIETEIDAYYLAFIEEQPAGVFKLQTEDRAVWPELRNDDSVFIHRLAVRRNFAKTGLSQAILDWVCERAIQLGKTYFRLDCDPTRLRLRKFYENFGFQFIDNQKVGRFTVARYELPLATRKQPQ